MFLIKKFTIAILTAGTLAGCTVGAPVVEPYVGYGVDIPAPVVDFPAVDWSLGFGGCCWGGGRFHGGGFHGGSFHGGGFHGGGRR